MGIDPSTPLLGYHSTGESLGTFIGIEPATDAELQRFHRAFSRELDTFDGENLKDFLKSQLEYHFGIARDLAPHIRNLLNENNRGVHPVFSRNFVDAFYNHN